jgi:hypothetical protein
MANLTWEISESLSPTDRTIFLNAVRECYGKDLLPEDGTNFEDFLNLLNPECAPVPCRHRHHRSRPISQLTLAESLAD